MSAKSELIETVSPSDSELFFGVVAPTGIDLTAFQGLLQDLLRQFGYSTAVTRLSDLARRAAVTPIDDTSHYTTIKSLQTAGNELRRQFKRGDILALHGIFEISNSRELIDGAAPPLRARLPKTAHLFRSLKHPDEVETLRRVYGAGFFLIGVYASQQARYEYLRDRLGMSDAEADEILKRDEDEPRDPFGQHTRDAFRSADVFIRDGDRQQLLRFLDLIFGSPFITPTRDEYAMFLAFASALRSAQFGRQVGAVVVSADGEIIGVGANDVPKYGGGLYGRIFRLRTIETTGTRTVTTRTRSKSGRSLMTCSPVWIASSRNRSITKRLEPNWRAHASTRSPNSDVLFTQRWRLCSRAPGRVSA